MLVLHTPQATLHAPKYEILSGTLQPYFEDPTRPQRILAALLQPPSPFELQEESWPIEELEQDWFSSLLREVHDEEYLQFLRTIYDSWVSEGGNPDAVLPETFLRRDLLLEDDRGSVASASAIESAGRYSFDLSAPITKDTWLCANASARLAVKGSEVLLANASVRGVFALCRPPGHHAAPSLCGGYCYLSNVAIAVKAYQQMALPRDRFHPEQHKRKVAILDIDYHHGNGSSKVFYSDPSVLYVSLHGSPDYPYFTGAEHERGSGAGLGFNINFPLPLGTDDQGYLKTLKSAIEQTRSFEPEVLFVSLGVDTFQDDPLTDFKITLDAYPRMGALIASLGVQTCFVMEGGYCLEQIGSCVRGLLEGFETASA